MSAMSVYEACGDAARQLMKDPRQRPVTEGPRALFTELDVITLAAREATKRGEPWAEHEMRMAFREASQYLAMLYRTGRLVRYGPVNVPGHGLDFMRLDSKIAYAPANGPEKVRTPNGTFPRLIHSESPIQRAGRKQGTNRSDLVKWADQSIEEPGRRVQMTPEEREIMRLKAEVQGCHEEMDELLQENERLRAQLASSVSRSEVEALIDQRLGKAA